VLDLHTCHLFAENGLDEEVEDLVEAGSITVATDPVFDRLDRVHAQLAALIVASQWKNNNSGAGLEALIRSTPVITSDRYAFYEALPAAQRQLAYRFGDAGSLADVLRQAIADPARLAALSRRTEIGWTEVDHVGGIADVIRGAARFDAGPPATVALSEARAASALVVADRSSAWVDVVDAYLAGRLKTRQGGLAIVATDDLDATQDELMRVVDRHGFTVESCPELSLVPLDEARDAIPSAAAYIASGASDETSLIELAGRCAVPVWKSATTWSIPIP